MSDLEQQKKEIQGWYKAALRTGLFKVNKEAADYGHALRKTGLVKDPTQGGTVKPPPPKKPIITGRVKTQIEALAHEYGSTPEEMKRLGTTKAFEKGRERQMSGLDKAQSFVGKAMVENQRAVDRQVALESLSHRTPQEELELQQLDARRRRLVNAHSQIQREAGGLLEMIQPGTMATIEERKTSVGGWQSALEQRAAQLVDFLPWLPLIEYTGGITGAGAIASPVFAGQMMADVAVDAMDLELRKRDPAQYWALLISGLGLAMAPEAGSEIFKELKRREGMKREAMAKAYAYQRQGFAEGQARGLDVGKVKPIPRRTERVPVKKLSAPGRIFGTDEEVIPIPPQPRPGERTEPPGRVRPKPRLVEPVKEAPPVEKRGVRPKPRLVTPETRPEVPPVEKRGVRPKPRLVTPETTPYRAPFGPPIERPGVRKKPRLVRPATPTPEGMTDAEHTAQTNVEALPEEAHQDYAQGYLNHQRGLRETPPDVPEGMTEEEAAAIRGVVDQALKGETEKAPEPTAEAAKGGEQGAVQEQKPAEEMLRAEGEGAGVGVGLPPVGEGKPQKPSREGSQKVTQEQAAQLVRSPQFQSAMKRGVFTAAHHAEVLKSVVRLIPVDVMDEFLGGKGASKRLLGNPSMLTDRLAIDNDSPVARRILSAIVTSARTVKPSLSKIAGKDIETVAAALAKPELTVTGAAPVGAEVGAKTTGLPGMTEGAPTVGAGKRVEGSHEDSIPPVGARDKEPQAPAAKGEEAPERPAAGDPKVENLPDFDKTTGPEHIKTLTDFLQEGTRAKAFPYIPKDVLFAASRLYARWEDLHRKVTDRSTITSAGQTLRTPVADLIGDRMTSIRAGLERIARDTMALEKGYKNASKEKVQYGYDVLKRAEEPIPEFLTREPKDKVEYVASKDVQWIGFEKPFTPEELAFFDRAEAAGMVKSRASRQGVAGRKYKVTSKRFVDMVDQQWKKELPKPQAAVDLSVATMEQTRQRLFEWMLGPERPTRLDINHYARMLGNTLRQSIESGRIKRASVEDFLNRFYDEAVAPQAGNHPDVELPTKEEWEGYARQGLGETAEKPPTAKALPNVGDIIEYERGYPPQTVQREVIRLQKDPVTGETVPIVKTATGEFPAAEWHDNGRVVKAAAEPTAAPPSGPSREEAIASLPEAARTRITRLHAEVDKARGPAMTEGIHLITPTAKYAINASTGKMEKIQTLNKAGFERNIRQYFDPDNPRMKLNPKAQEVWDKIQQEKAAKAEADRTAEETRKLAEQAFERQRQAEAAAEATAEKIKTEIPAQYRTAKNALDTYKKEKGATEASLTKTAKGTERPRNWSGMTVPQRTYLMDALMAIGNHLPKEPLITVREVAKGEYNIVDVKTDRLIRKTRGSLEQAQALADIAHREAWQELFTNQRGITIEVPGDGKFTVKTAEQALRMHEIIEKGESVAQTTDFGPEFPRGDLQSEAKAHGKTVAEMITKEAAEPPGWAARLRKTLDTTEKAADARIKKRNKGQIKSMIAPDPRDLTDMIIVGSVKLARGVLDAGEWGRQMVAKYGKGIEPHLNQIYLSAVEHYNREFSARFGTPPIRPADALLDPAAVEKPAEPSAPPTEPAKLTAPAGGGEPLFESQAARDPANLARKIAGLDLMPVERQPAMEEAFKESHDRGLDQAAYNMARRLIHHPRNLSAVETASIAQKTAQLQIALYQNRVAAEQALSVGDVAKARDIKALHDDLQHQLDIITQAVKISGEEWHKTGMARQQVVDQYNFIGARRRLQMANVDRPVSESEEATLREVTNELTVVEGAILTRQAEARGETPPATEAAKETAPTEKKAETKGAAPKKEVAKAAEPLPEGFGAKNKIYTRERFADAMHKLRLKLGRPGADVFPGARFVEMLPELIEAGGYFVEGGLRAFGDWADRMRADVHKELDDATLQRVWANIRAEAKEAKEAEAGAPKPLSKVFVDELGRRMGLSNARDFVNEYHDKNPEAFQKLLEGKQIDLAERKEVADIYRKHTPDKKPVSGSAALKALGEALSETRVRKPPTEESRQRAAATRIENDIKSLSEQIAKGERTPRKQRTPQDNAELRKLRGQREALRKQLDRLVPRPPRAKPTIEKLRTMKERRLTKQIAGLDAQIAAKKRATPATRPEVTSPEIKKLEALRDAKQKQLDKVAPRPARRPRAPLTDAQKIEIRKRMALRTIKEYQRQIASGQPTGPKTRGPAPSDMELDDLLKKKADLKAEIDRMIVKREKMHPGQMFVRLLRSLALLTGTQSAEKITSAAVIRTFVSTPIEEIYGAFLTPLMPKEIREKAFREAGWRPSDEAAAMKNLWTKETLDDMLSKFKTNQNSLDRMYGKPEGHYNPWIDFAPGLHGVLKTATQRAEFGRSVWKRTRNMSSMGYDVRSPDVQAQILAGAYGDSLRAILQGNNRIVSAWNQAIRYMEAGGPMGKSMATIARTGLPIVRVPSNFVGETAQHVLGTPEGIMRVIVYQVTKKMTPEGADKTLRAFKRGGVGLGMVMAGFVGIPGIKFGGFYSPGQKARKHGELGFGEIEFFGIRLSHWISHSPFMAAFQMGATARNIYNQSRKMPVADRYWNTGIGSVYALGSQTPFFETPMQMGEAFRGGPGKAGKVAADYVGEMIPMFLQEYAAGKIPFTGGMPGVDDPNVKRHPRGFREELKMKVPGLRQQVPTEGRYQDIQKERRAEAARDRGK